MSVVLLLKEFSNCLNLFLFTQEKKKLEIESTCMINVTTIIEQTVCDTDFCNAMNCTNIKQRPFSHIQILYIIYCLRYFWCMHDIKMMPHFCVLLVIHYVHNLALFNTSIYPFYIEEHLIFYYKKFYFIKTCHIIVLHLRN